MGTIIRWLLAILIIIIAIIVFVLTPLGSRVVLELASKVVPGQLSYAKFSGSLIGPLTIDQFNYQHGASQFSIGRLELQWNPAALLQGRLSIQKLVIDQLNIITPQTQKTNTQKKFFTIPHLKPLHLPFKLQIDHASIQDIRWGHQINQWLVQIPQTQIFGVAAPEHIDFHINTQLQQPQNLTLNFDVYGALNHYTLQLKLHNDSTDWLIIGAGDQQSLQLQTTQSKILHGNLTAQLALNWQSTWQWQGQLDAKQLNLQPLNQHWPKNITLQLKSAGTLVNDKPQFSWRLDATTKNNHIYSDGQYQNQWQATWNIDIKKLRELIANSQGSIQSQGQLSGNWPNLNTQGKLDAQNINWQDNAAQEVHGQWSVDLSQRSTSSPRGITVSHSSIALMGKQIDLFGFLLQSLSLNANGNLQQQQINFSITNDLNQIDATLAGRWQDDSWHASLQQLKLKSAGAGSWQLQQPTEFSFYNKQKFTLPPLCITAPSTKAYICISANQQQGQWQAKIDSKFDLQQFQSLLPADWQLQAPVSIQLDASGNNNIVEQTQASFTLGSGRFTMPRDDNSVSLAFQSAKVNLQIQQPKKLAQLMLQVQINNSNSINAQFTFPNYSQQQLLDKQQAIKGELDMALKDTSFINTFIPDITIAAGQLQGKWLVSGTLATPHLNGQMNFLRGRVNIPKLNIALENAQITATTSEKLMNFHASVTSAGHSLQADGKIDLTQPKFPIDIHVKGQNVLVINTPEYIVYATPDITINVTGFDVKITGNATIPQATIQPVDLKGAVTLPDEDVIMIGGSKKSTQNPFKTTINVTFYAGNNINLDAMGLKGRIDGKLTILQEPNQTAMGAGHINIIDGSYNILGRVLTLGSSSGVTYRQNPLDNPNLAVQAYTIVTVSDTTGQELDMNNVKVGVNIAGTANSPQFTFFSSPATLSQNDIVSYLVLGSSSNAASPAAASILFQAVTSMRPGGHNNISNLNNRIKQSLGFSELGVVTEPTLTPLGEPTNKQSTYVVLGKRITPRLSARYKFDPFSSTNILTLYYLLTQHVRIQTEKSSLGTGGDILYTIEKKSEGTGDKDSEQKINTPTNQSSNSQQPQ